MNAPASKQAACYYCRRAFASGELRTFDHKVPRARGGSNKPGNLVVACTECNGEKGDLTHDEFFLYRQVTGHILHRAKKRMEFELWLRRWQHTAFVRTLAKN
jgi:5-methylcytosine-specific restriction endonuclease McrA